MLKFRGIPYIAFGYRSLFTSRRYEIEKVWYIKDGWKFPIIIKSFILNPRRRYLNTFLRKIKEHSLNFNLLVSVFDDKWETTKEYEYEIGKDLEPNSMLIVRDENDNYIGIPEDVHHLFKFSQLETSSSGNVISAGFNPVTQSWCGWSHRAKACFGLGDKIFEEDFGDEKTPYINHGSVSISTLDQAKESALKFAKYVS